ncbi:DUF3325 domain-containing protein [Algiphilus sp.]|uniref:DUF3325 domain-containing protein n=1 Tax=Algiphilus sp. TaxID=1872431 RepID=UPI0025C3F82E|nr:DUF3325 domain-containing protein [Algiphilus sp.]MCK5769885.1 DUF3325 domain-containing protein [Algiphilus sp.]
MALVWVLILASAYAGFGLLALAMERHRRTLLPGSRAWTAVARRSLRCVGALCLLVSLVGCVVALGTTIGVVGWCGVLTVGAMVVMGQISYREAGQRRGHGARRGR